MMVDLLTHICVTRPQWVDIAIQVWKCLLLSHHIKNTIPYSFDKSNLAFMTSATFKFYGIALTLLHRFHMSIMASQITSNWTHYSTAYTGLQPGNMKTTIIGALFVCECTCCWQILLTKANNSKTISMIWHYHKCINIQCCNDDIMIC